MKAKAQTSPITTDSITRQPLLLFFPVLLSTFFQQFYNTVDTMITGSFAGTSTTLAVVGGATGQLVNLFVGFFISLPPDCGVTTLQYYGTRDRNVVSRGIHTVLTFSLVSGIMTMVLDLALTRFSLRAMSLPDEIMSETFAYLRIYSLGVVPNLFYNMGTAVLRAVGSSRCPFYFPTLSCLGNIALDLVFAVSLYTDIMDAALATIPSQTASAVMILYILLHMDSKACLDPWGLRMDFGRLKKTIHVGPPANLQSTIYTIPSIVVQTTVNSFDTNTITAAAVYGKVDVLFWMVINTFGTTVTAFVGQNYGAGQVKCTFQGLCVPFALSASAILFLSTVIWFFGVNSLHFFAKDPTVLAIHRRLIHYAVPLFITYIPVELCSGALRGMDNSRMLMIVTIIDACMLRLFQIFPAMLLHRNILTLMMTYPISWITTSVMLGLYLFLTRHHYHSKNLMKQNEKSTTV